MNLKRRIQSAAFRSGLTSALQAFGSRRWGRAGGGVLVFYGHHVLEDAGGGGHLRAPDLHDRLVYLHRHFDVVSAAEALAWLRAPQPGARLAVVSFDDGYRDNLLHGLPVFRSTRTPVTIFVVTGPVMAGAMLWFDQVRQAFRSSKLPEIAVSWLEEPVAPAEPGLADRIVASLKAEGPAARDRKTAELLEALGPPGATSDLASCRMLSAEELSVLAREPLVTLGAHTHSHVVLPACSHQEMVRELETNLEALRGMTGLTPTLFAYPNGELSEAARAAVVEVGFEAAFSTQTCLNTPASDRWALGRYPLGRGPVSQFAWELARPQKDGTRGERARG